MSLQDFLKSAKQGQTVWLFTAGFMVRGTFLKYDPGLEFVTINQVAIFQGPQATGSVASLSVAVNAIQAWG
jgi:hypothetical protein